MATHFVEVVCKDDVPQFPTKTAEDAVDLNEDRQGCTFISQSDISDNVAIILTCVQFNFQLTRQKNFYFSK